MPTAYVSCRDGTHLQLPSLSLRVGVDVAHEDDLRDAVAASTDDRASARFPTVALSRQRARLLHVVLQGPRAGAPWARLVTLAVVNPVGQFRTRGAET